MRHTEQKDSEIKDAISEKGKTRVEIRHKGLIMRFLTKRKICIEIEEICSREL